MERTDAIGHIGAVQPPLSPAGKTRFSPNSMKTTAIRSLTFIAFIACLLTLGLTSCNRSDRADVSAKADGMMADTKNVLAHGWENVKSFTFEKRDDFRANANALTSKMDARMSELRANYSDAKASASRRAAMAEVKDSEAAYKETLDALGKATADTWESAKQNVILAWDRLQASYYKARSD